MVQGVIFDVGGTLIYSNDDYFEAGNCWAAANHLRSLGLLTDRVTFGKRLLALRQNSPKGDAEHRQVSTTRNQLQEIAQSLGIILEVNALQSTERAFVMPEAAGAIVIPGILGLVQRLQSSGVRLAVVSNTRSHLLIVASLEHIGLSGVFNPVVTSVSCGIRKPGARIFETVLQDWGIPAEAVVMIGDGEDRDVVGAKALGMRSILLTADSSKTLVDSEADAVASASEDIARILQDWGLSLED